MFLLHTLEHVETTEGASTHRDRTQATEACHIIRRCPHDGHTENLVVVGDVSESLDSRRSVLEAPVDKNTHSLGL
jgi:hypothetical protein